MQQLLTLDGYVRQTGKSERTVRRWLADGRLEGAHLDDAGMWVIPADAVPGAPGSAGPRPVGTAVAATSTPRAAGRAPAVAAAPTLPALLDGATGYLDVDTAARLLGIPAAAIRRHRGDFDAVPYGPHGSLVVPQAAVRRVAGIGA